MIATESIDNNLLIRPVQDVPPGRGIYFVFVDGLEDAGEMAVSREEIIFGVGFRFTAGQPFCLIGPVWAMSTTTARELVKDLEAAIRWRSATMWTHKRMSHRKLDCLDYPWHPGLAP